MNTDDRGRTAGADARRVGSEFTPPDLERTIKRRRRGRVVGAAVLSALMLVLVVGVGALLTRTDPEIIPADTSTTTTTTAPDNTTPTTTTSSPPTTTTAAALPTEPGYGGVVKVASGTDMIYGFQDVDGTFVPASINPLLPSGQGNDVARLTVPGAFRLDPGTGVAKPWVVNPIPTVENGGVVVADGRATVTYQINPEAVWADGTPITFDDFAFTHELIMSEDLPISGNLRELHSLINTASLDGEGKTVTFDLTELDLRYERLFQWLVPAHAVSADTFLDDWNDQLWLSGGPFVFDHYEPTTSQETQPGTIYLGRNDNYWEYDDRGNQLPYLDGIEVQVWSPGAVNPATPVSWFNNQETDVVLPGLIYWELGQQLFDSAEDGFAAARSWDSLYEMIGFEMRDSRLEINPDSLNNDLLYRRAVLSAIDRAAIADETGYPPATSIAGTASPGLDIDVWQQYDDSAQTAELMAQLGDTLGRDFSTDPPAAHFTSSPGDGTMLIGDAATALLETAGWDITTEYTWDFFNINLPEGRNDIFSVRLFAGDGLADLVHMLSFFDPTLPDDEILFGWSTIGEPAARYAELVVEMQTTLDRERLQQLVTEAETILADNAVLYPLVRRQATVTYYWPDRVQGVIPLQNWETATAAWWWSPDPSGDTSPEG